VRNVCFVRGSRHVKAGFKVAGGEKGSAELLLCRCELKYSDIFILLYRIPGIIQSGFKVFLAEILPIFVCPEHSFAT
jgi:hypothetical protein